jgi:hypothetical protein
MQCMCLTLAIMLAPRLCCRWCCCCCCCRAMCSIEQEQLPGGRRVVMMATPSALYIAAGGPGLQGLFGRCVSCSTTLLCSCRSLDGNSYHAEQCDCLAA